jgi:S-(hydroxymethyl)glutathione dehydrogenase / alcohol dehydrogenase
MKAVVYRKPYELSLENVPDPELRHNHEMIVRITSTAICGSDLHLYHGLYPHCPCGTVLGHEFMGIVEEVGKDVMRWKRGDRVLVPFPIACGECEMCQKGLWPHCLNANAHPHDQGAIFGHGEDYGGIPGGQAEYVRVPFADISPIAVPDDLTDEQALFVTDILPTAYWITDVCKVTPGATVAVFGCGPVGQLVQRCAIFRGARRVFAVDQIPYRLQYAERLNPGVETINFQEIDPGKAIKEMTEGRGVDIVIDAVGLEAEPTGLAVSAMVGMKRLGVPPLPGTRAEDNPPVASVSAIHWEVAALRHGGTLGLAGAYGAQANGFPIGDIFLKGLTLKTGQALVQNYTQELLNYIQQGKIRADDIITHNISLTDALAGYQKFGRREDGCLKVVMHPFQ